MSKSVWYADVLRYVWNRISSASKRVLPQMHWKEFFSKIGVGFAIGMAITVRIRYIRVWQGGWKSYILLSTAQELLAYPWCDRNPPAGISVQSAQTLEAKTRWMKAYSDVRPRTGKTIAVLLFSRVIFKQMIIFKNSPLFRESERERRKKLCSGRKKLCSDRKILVVGIILLPIARHSSGFLPSAFLPFLWVRNR